MIGKVQLIFAKVRMRRGALLFASVGVVVLCISILCVLRPRKTSSPSIEIRGINYVQTNYVKGDRYLLARFTITNCGSAPFLVDPTSDYMLRLETGTDGVTRDQRYRKYTTNADFIRLGPERPVQPGDTLGVSVDLPPDTVWWQIGYGLRSVSAKQALESKIGSEWSGRIMKVFGGWISEPLPTETVVWSPIFKVKGAGVKGRERAE